MAPREPISASVFITVRSYALNDLMHLSSLDHSYRGVTGAGHLPWPFDRDA